MRTKIVATLGPASTDKNIMKEMVRFGVRIFRLNFSHSNAAHFAPIVQQIREVEKETGICLTIMGDLCGPKIRIGEVAGSPLQIDKGDKVFLGAPNMADKSNGTFISLDIPELLEGLAPDMAVSLSDGMLQFRVTQVVEPDQLVIMEAQNGGILTSNKGITFPGKTLKVAAMTEKDRQDLHGLDIGTERRGPIICAGRDDIDDLKAEISDTEPGFRWWPGRAQERRGQAGLHPGRGRRHHGGQRRSGLECSQRNCRHPEKDCGPAVTPRNRPLATRSLSMVKILCLPEPNPRT